LDRLQYIGLTSTVPPNQSGDRAKTIDADILAGSKPLDVNLR
jgi:hypothetical protein